MSDQEGRTGAMKMSTPLVSVVIPAYSCAAFINDTLESVYNQTYTNWEIIVVDDGSPDDTRAILSPHMHRIRYLYQENKGTAAARNAGLQRARGELIAFLDNDDIWLPEKLELQVRTMQSWPECGLVFTDGKTFDETGIRAHSTIWNGLDQWICENQTADPTVIKGWLSREFVLQQQISCASSVMVRKECLETVGRFDERITISDDYDLWFRIAQRYPMILIASCLYLWRWREDSQSGPVETRMQRWNEAGIVVLEKHWPTSPPELRIALRARLSRLYWDGARTYFGEDQFRDARRMLLGCLRHNRLFVPAILLILASYLSSSSIRRLRGIKRRVWRLQRRNDQMQNG